MLFLGAQSSAELDLFIVKNGKRIGYTNEPTITKSMLLALQDLKLDHLYVVYPQNMPLLLSYIQTKIDKSEKGYCYGTIALA